MKTDDLIRALARDTVLEAPVSAMRGAGFALASAVAAGLAFLALLGPRADLAGSVAPIALKVTVTGLVAGAGLLLAMRLWRPGDAGPSHAPVLLALAAGILAGWMLVLSVMAPRDLVAGLVGPNAWHCMVAIPVLAMPTLAVLVAAARRSAVTQPGRAAASAGLAAAGLAAIAYAFFCVEDSPLFVAVWYGLAALVVQGVSLLAFRRFVHW